MFINYNIISGDRMCMVVIKKKKNVFYNNDE